MATNKTLSPTNVTIAIPAMGDQPDASVFSNCIDKEADAINTLNSQIAVPTKVTDLNNATNNNAVYYFDTGTQNAPSAFSYGFVEVVSQGNNVHQTAVGRGGSDVTYTYERSRSANGTWGEWVSYTSYIGNIRYTYTNISSNKNTAVKRLHEQWSAFSTYMATKMSSGIVCFVGFINFPAYNGGTELGTYYAWGSFNVANSQGTVFMTQYHADNVWIYKNHGSSASAIQINGTSVDIT